MIRPANGGVLCSGNVVYDTLVRPVEEWCWGTTTFVESIEYHIGGNGANTSIALAKLSVPVRLLATVGRDDQGRFVSEALRAAGVDTRELATVEAPTAATVAIVNRAGNRKFLHRMGASAVAFPVPIEFTPRLTDGISHYHLASLCALPKLRRHAPETLARARAAGLTTSLDTNWDAEGRWMRDLGPCLPELDFLFINEDEARMITGSVVIPEAARMLLEAGARTAVMKVGPRGCAIYTADEEILCPAFEVDAMDTTCAGDCFVGGFLAALLRGETLAEAGHFANAVAALSVQRLGGAAGVPVYPEVVSWMKSARLRRD
jgi:sugar/nucleoside kinase (ribokinase family)